MEVTLVGLLFIGIERGSVGVVVNTGVALAVTRLPSILERDYGIPMDPRITLWITSAAFLHALGTVGIPGITGNLYRQFGWWDHMTHALSASVVAAAGYATVRAIDEHSENVYLPSKMMVVFILLFVLAVGVVWELIEFTLDLAAHRYGFEAALAQHGVNDTVTDLLFNLAGAVVAATVGATYLTNVSRQLADRFGNREP
jgi:hypothetical protein